MQSILLSAIATLALSSLISAQNTGNFGGNFGGGGGGCGQFQVPCSGGYGSDCVDPTCNQQTVRIRPGGCRCEYGTARNPQTQACVQLSEPSCQQYGLEYQEYDQLYQGYPNSNPSGIGQIINDVYNQIGQQHPGGYGSNYPSYPTAGYGQGNYGSNYNQQGAYNAYNNMGGGAYNTFSTARIPIPTAAAFAGGNYQNNQNYNYPSQQLGGGCPQSMVACQGSGTVQSPQQMAPLCAQQRYPCPRPTVVPRIQAVAPNCGCQSNNAVQPAYCQPQRSGCQTAPIVRAPVIVAPQPTVVQQVVQTAPRVIQSAQNYNNRCPTGMNLCGQQQAPVNYQNAVCARAPIPCPKPTIVQRVAQAAPACGCNTQTVRAPVRQAICAPVRSQCNTRRVLATAASVVSNYAPTIASSYPRVAAVAFGNNYPTQGYGLGTQQNYNYGSSNFGSTNYASSNSVGVGCPTGMNQCPCAQRGSGIQQQPQSLCCGNGRSCPNPVMASRIVQNAPSCGCGGQQSAQPNYCNPSIGCQSGGGAQTGFQTGSISGYPSGGSGFQTGSISGYPSGSGFQTGGISGYPSRSGFQTGGISGYQSGFQAAPQQYASGCSGSIRCGKRTAKKTAKKAAKKTKE